MRVVFSDEALKKRRLTGKGRLKAGRDNAYRFGSFAGMKIDRDCSSPLHFGSFALIAIPLRSLPAYCSGPLLTPRFASCSSLLIIPMYNAL
jgi:hypothetical protein